MSSLLQKWTGNSFVHRWIELGCVLMDPFIDAIRCSVVPISLPPTLVQLQPLRVFGSSASLGLLSPRLLAAGEPAGGFQRKVRWYPPGDLHSSLRTAAACSPLILCYSDFVPQSAPARCLFDGMPEGPADKEPISSAGAAAGDAFAALPDEILQHVLSFLPAQPAVRTCVLARRWRQLWEGAAGLRITVANAPEPPCAPDDLVSSGELREFVDHLLLLPGGAPLDNCEFLFDVHDPARHPVSSSAAHAQYHPGE